MSLLNAAQLGISIIIITLILIQERQSGVSGLFGGGESGYYQTRRGLEKVIFRATLALVAVFALLSLAHLLI